jgi:hypothetical protein
MTEKSLTDETGRNSADPKHAPVSLPAGSYDVDKLDKGLGQVVKAKPEERDGVIHDVLTEAFAGETLDRGDPALAPGFKRVEVAHPELDGVKENAVVFDEKLDEKERERAAGEAEAREVAQAAVRDADRPGAADQAQSSRAAGRGAAAAGTSEK